MHKNETTSSFSSSSLSRSPEDVDGAEDWILLFDRSSEMSSGKFFSSLMLSRLLSLFPEMLSVFKLLREAKDSILEMLLSAKSNTWRFCRISRPTVLLKKFFAM